MGITILIAVLFIIWGFLWTRRIFDSEANDDEALGDTIPAILLMLIGAVILLITGLVYIARHVHWWSWS